MRYSATDYEAYLHLGQALVNDAETDEAQDEAFAYWSDALAGYVYAVESEDDAVSDDEWLGL